MDNIEQWIQELEQGHEQAEDRTIYSRETPGGTRVDFEIIERTRFGGAFPETVKELQAKGPLPCGHQVGKDNPFGGYCQGRRYKFPLSFRRCERAYCAQCAIQCPRCGIFVSANCHAGNFESVMYCKTCKRKMSVKRAIRNILFFLIYPFIEQEGQRDVRDEIPEAPDRSIKAF